MQSTAQKCRSGDNLQKYVLAFYHMGPRDRTQVFRLGSRHLYSLSHLTGSE